MIDWNDERQSEVGAEGGSRTRTSFRTMDFKSTASAIPPPRHVARNPNSTKSLLFPLVEIPLASSAVRKRCWTGRSVTTETIKSIRFVSDNPEEKFFTTLKDFRFNDEGAFDFRGWKQFSVYASEETLSDSNKRASISLEFQNAVTAREREALSSLGLRVTT
jgi:hypothetical protein